MALPLNLEQDQIQRIQAVRAKEEEIRKQREAAALIVVAKIHKARKDAETAANTLQEAATELRSLTRRNYDESASTYIVFANAHLRLAGALLQGARRTASMDRLLVNVAREQEEARWREDQDRKHQEVRVHAKLVQKLELPTDDDFEELYGDVVTDAV